MPLFSSPTSPGRGLARFGAGVPEFVEFLVIAGGGGAGAQRNTHTYRRYKPWREEFSQTFPAYCQDHYVQYAGAGGGGGGYISSVAGEYSGRLTSPVSTLVPTSGTNYYISIGAGGAGQGGTGNGGKGGNTSFAGITATGGGYGGYTCCGGGSNGGSGGSGGGGGPAGNNGDSQCNSSCGGSSACGSSAGGSGTSAQGFPGTNYGAGGAGGAGAYGVGGAGITSTITGSSVSYSNGQGGSDYGDGAPVSYGSAGRPGAVIIRFQGVEPDIDAGLGYSINTVGANTVIVFSSGTGNISW